MDVNVTRILEEDLMDFAASPEEIGPEAGRITWRNSLEAARTSWGRQLAHHADDPAAFYDEARDHFREYGAWDREEIAAWDKLTIRAMVIQEAASGLRELEAVRERYPDMTDEELSESGLVSGRVCVDRDEDGEPVTAHLYLGG